MCKFEVGFVCTLLNYATQSISFYDPGRQGSFKMSKKALFHVALKKKITKKNPTKTKNTHTLPN